MCILPLSLQLRIPKRSSPPEDLQFPSQAQIQSDECLASLPLHPVLFDPAEGFGSPQGLFAKAATDMRFYPKNKSTVRMFKTRRAVPDTAVMAHMTTVTAIKSHKAKVDIFKTARKIKME